MIGLTHEKSRRYVKIPVESWFLGHPLEPRNQKSCKTDEYVEICRNQANRDKNENLCKWHLCVVYKGFLHFMMRMKM